MDGITMEDLVEAHRNAYNVVDGLVDRDQAYCLIEDKLVKKKGNSFKLIKQNQLNIIELPDVIIFPNIYDKPIQTNDNLRNMWNQSKIPLFSDIQEALRDSELISYSHYDRQRMMREGMMDVKKKKKKRSISGRRQMKITNVHMIDKIVGLMNKKQPGQ
ncbi:MAG: hypothetical protein EZS28_011758 [Streblomastix strix]|uniref:Uncharacterized protein n=1 Tax=Streblomastix strix TaxID=222440 RepID=A0A5J4WCP6_9EUKA|nr:MAG: hypothetical protein EZS28_011758 [Streblomastix strix]